MAQQGTGRSILPLGADPVPSIPDKLYFRIGEVAELCGVPTYVLRFWESEFPQLKPNKGGTGQRLYRRKDVETARRIRELLYEGKFTIPGARQALRTEQEQEQSAPPQLPLTMAENIHAEPGGLSSLDRRALSRMQQELRELRELLLSPATEGPKGGAVQPIRAGRAADALPQSDDLFE